MNIHTVELLLVKDKTDDAEPSIRKLKHPHFINNISLVRDSEEALDFIFVTEKYLGLRSLEIHPRLILPEIKMPATNEMALIKKNKSDGGIKTKPAVMLTSSKEDHKLKSSYQFGANSIIVKPVNFAGLAESYKNPKFYWILLNKPPQ